MSNEEYLFSLPEQEFLAFTKNQEVPNRIIAARMARVEQANALAYAKNHEKQQQSEADSIAQREQQAREAQAKEAKKKAAAEQQAREAQAKEAKKKAAAEQQARDNELARLRRREDAANLERAQKESRDQYLEKQKMEAAQRNYSW